MRQTLAGSGAHSWSPASARRWNAFLVACTLVLSAAAAVRWERPRRLAPDLRAPAWSRVVRSERRSGTCRWWLHYPAAPAIAVAAQVGEARRRGWRNETDAAGEGPRAALRHGDRRLTVVAHVQRTSGARLRLQLSPCPNGPGAPH